jgi:hypothetical protein
MATYQATRARPSVRTVRLPVLRLPTLASVRQVALTVGGLGCLTAAAWTVALGFGLAAAGVSCLVINFLSTDGGPQR